MGGKSLGYSSQVALALSLIAGSVGTGNIWRFPRVVAANGGGAFIVAWLIMVVVVCLPIMLGEHAMGRTTRHGTPGAFKDFIGKHYTWLGTAVAVIMALVASYYSAVVAWVSYYLGLSFTNGYFGVDKVEMFNSVSNGNIITVLLFVLVILISAWISYKGVSGIEKANKIFLPVLIGCLIFVAVKALTLPNASVGLNYLFQFDFNQLLNYKTWLEALTQAIWSTGPGWGLVITLAVFSRAKSDINLTTTIQVFGDASVSLIAALAVIPTIFALTLSSGAAVEILQSGNNGMTFISMTTLFEKMQGGQLVSIMFFLSLLFAALSSNVCHVMIVSLPFADSKVNRKKTFFIVLTILLIWGLPSAWSADFLTNQDWVAGQMMLVGGLFSCFAIIRFGTTKIREKFLNNPYTGFNIGVWWEIAIKFISPLIVAIMFLWWSYQSISWDPQWWNPLSSSSLMTFLLQGSTILFVAYLFNNKVAKSIENKYFDGENIPPVPNNGYSA